MENFDLMKNRHSVRQYTDKKIESETRKILDDLIMEINQEEGLHIQVIYDEPKCFDSFKAHYGKFSGVANYIALVGRKSKNLDEKLGYYGEKIVLKSQELGLNTCWVALTHGKSKAVIDKGEKLVCLIALGYGETSGVCHKNKPINQVSNYQEGMPEWFQKGIEAALLAPTAMNQQKFCFEYSSDGKIHAKCGTGFYTKLDLGIVKYHFDLVSGKHTL